MLIKRLPRPVVGSKRVGTTRDTSSISALQAAFRDPSSPFHIPPGTQGPDSPDSPPHMSTLAGQAEPQDALDEARAKLRKVEMDPASFWEQPIVWGDMDSFQHVNNVRYVRFFESARIKWMLSLGEEIGGPERAKDMMKGKGLSLILKSIDVSFRRPVTYPDTLLIGFKPVNTCSEYDLATFNVAASAYSLQQKSFVAHSKEALVWYDYDKLKKSDPGQHIRDVLGRRMRTE